jgi:hypothetical protein
VRIYVYNALFAFAASLGALRWLFGTVPPETYILSGVVAAVAYSLLSTVAGISSLPMEMLTFPKSRFGSFCSAQALLRSTIATLTAFAVGGLFDWLRTLFPDSDTFHYRFVYLWPVPWALVCVVLAYWAYREWGRLGGYESYAAPAVWAPEGREPVTQPAVHYPSGRLLGLALLGYDLLVASGIGITLYFFRRYALAGEAAVGRLFLELGLPAALGIAVVWLLVRRGIVRDLRRCRAGQPPKNGIPHPGLLLCVLLIHAVGNGLCAYQLPAVESGAAIYFLLNQHLCLLAVVLSIGLIARMERGIVARVAEREPVAARPI